MAKGLYQSHSDTWAMDIHDNKCHHFTNKIPPPHFGSRAFFVLKLKSVLLCLTILNKCTGDGESECSLHGNENCRVPWSTKLINLLINLIISTGSSLMGKISQEWCHLQSSTPSSETMGISASQTKCCNGKPQSINKQLHPKNDLGRESPRSPGFFPNQILLQFSLEKYFFHFWFL